MALIKDPRQRLMYILSFRKRHLQNGVLPLQDFRLFYLGRWKSSILNSRFEGHEIKQILCKCCFGQILINSCKLFCKTPAKHTCEEESNIRLKHLNLGHFWQCTCCWGLISPNWQFFGKVTCSWTYACAVFFQCCTPTLLPYRPISVLTLDYNKYLSSRYLSSVMRSKTCTL